MSEITISSDLLRLSDFDHQTLEQIARRAVDLAACWDARDMPQSLHGARIGVIEELPGWRNPTALALGTAQMGATCVRVTARLEGQETPEDLAGYMDNWFDLLAVRTPHLSRLQSFADALTAPVVNLRTHDNHPCEVLGDLAYVLSERGTWQDLRVAIVGPVGNIARSWKEAASVLPIEVIHIAPPHLQFAQDSVSGWSSTDDPRAMEEADLIVTDCWPPNATDNDKTALAAHRIDAALLDRCRPDVMFVPCPPVTRGEEVSDDAMCHQRCVATPAKAYLMHVQNAAVEALL